MTSHPRRTLLLAALTLATTASTIALSAAPASAGPASAFRTSHTCGTPQIPRAPYPAPVFAGNVQRTIYLNRTGGTYQIINGSTSSAGNTASTDVSANGQPRTAVIAPLGNGFNWATISQCVRNHYAPYNVRVTETEPTSGAYVEAVVGGTGTELGFGANELFGIAAADNFCGVTESGIAFSFSETHRGVPQADAELCATIAHEVGHVLALEHEGLATDLMSYVLVSETTSKSFVDMNSACGVTPSQPQSCTCPGGNTTNSAARLRMFLGARPTETTPPVLTLDTPDNNGTVGPTFTIEATATDNDAIADVTFVIDGIVAGVVDTATGTTYALRVTGLSVGGHNLTATATDRAGNTATATAAFTVSLDCGDCGPGRECVQGECQISTGEACDELIPCAGGVCATGSDGNFCTSSCDLANDTCPSGFACEAAGDTAVCNFDGSGGCCSAGGATSPGQLASLALLILAVGLALRTRRARRA